MTSAALLDRVDDFLAPTLQQQVAWIKRASVDDSDDTERHGPAPIFSDVAPREFIRDYGVDLDAHLAVKDALAKEKRLNAELAEAVVELRTKNAGLCRLHDLLRDQMQAVSDRLPPDAPTRVRRGCKK